MINDSVNIQGRSAMDNVEMAYARQVYIYNDQVIQGGVLPKLGDKLAEAAETFDDKVKWTTYKLIAWTFLFECELPELFFECMSFDFSIIILM